MNCGDSIAARQLTATSSEPEMVSTTARTACAEEKHLTEGGSGVEYTGGLTHDNDR